MEPIHFHLFECGKNILNRIDATFERSCMANSRYKYYTEMLRTITDYNDRNDAPLLNDKIQEAINKLIEEEYDFHNVTADTFSHTSNIQRDNTNAIFTSEKLDK